MVEGIDTNATTLNQVSQDPPSQVSDKQEGDSQVVVADSSKECSDDLYIPMDSLHAPFARGLNSMDTLPSDLLRNSLNHQNNLYLTPEVILKDCQDDQQILSHHQPTTDGDDFSSEVAQQPDQIDS